MLFYFPFFVIHFTELIPGTVTPGLPAGKLYDSIQEEFQSVHKKTQGDKRKEDQVSGKKG